MTSPPYNWIREIKPELRALDEIPLTGSAPPFPWKELASHLAKTFQLQHVELIPKEIRWLSQSELFDNLGDQPAVLAFAIPSLNGEAYWVMPEQEMVILESLILTKDSHPLNFQDRSLSESFYRFVGLEILYQISQLQFDRSLVPVLTSHRQLPRQEALCLDIAVVIEQQFLWGRLIISPELRRSWVEHFAQSGPSPLTKELAKKIDITLHIEIGHIQLAFQDWLQVALGDVILLDHCSLDKDTLEGRVMLTLHNHPAFRGKLKDGTIKILEFPLYHEVESPMANQSNDDFPNFPPEDDENEIEGEDLGTDEELTLGDTDLDADDELTEDFEEISEEKLEESPAATQAAAPSEMKTTASPAPIQPNQIPLKLTIEVGHIQMTIEKLLELEPGNLLELSVRPEEGVDLVINGKVVGKGELVRIGDVLGIRVLELGQ